MHTYALKLYPNFIIIIIKLIMIILQVLFRLRRISEPENFFINYNAMVYRLSFWLVRVLRGLHTISILIVTFTTLFSTHKNTSRNERINSPQTKRHLSNLTNTCRYLCKDVLSLFNKQQTANALVTAALRKLSWCFPCSPIELVG